MKPDQFQQQQNSMQQEHQLQPHQTLVDSSGSAIGSDKNVMPSVILRQQRIQMGTSANQRGEQTSQQQPQQLNPTSSSIFTAANEQQQVFDQDGLVLPKRVIHHPISLAQPIIRDLNRELKFNQIRGKNVLDQKSELKKALEKLEESKRKKEVEQERLNRRTSLELRLEERAERIAKQNSAESPQQVVGQQQQQPAPAGVGENTTCKPLSNFSIRSVTR